MFLSAHLKKIMRAFGYACKGLLTAWREEMAFRIELVLCVPMVLLALFLGRTGAEQALLMLTCFLVLLTELLNSAVEAVVDRIGPERHPVSAKAKDLAAAALLVSLVAALAVWGVVLYRLLYGEI